MRTRVFLIGVLALLLALSLNGLVKAQDTVTLRVWTGGSAGSETEFKEAQFAAFEEAGLEDEAAVRSTGRRYRDTVLARGGSQHPMEVFRAFRGREPSTEPLLRHSGLAPAASG